MDRPAVRGQACGWRRLAGFSRLGAPAAGGTCFGGTRAHADLDRTLLSHARPRAAGVQQRWTRGARADHSTCTGGVRRRSARDVPQRLGAERRHLADALRRDRGLRVRAGLHLRGAGRGAAAQPGAGGRAAPAAGARREQAAVCRCCRAGPARAGCLAPAEHQRQPAGRRLVDERDHRAIPRRRRLGGRLCRLRPLYRRAGGRRREDQDLGADDDAGAVRQGGGETGSGPTSRRSPRRCPTA